MAGGLVNFYSNSDYDKNITSKYVEVLNFNGTKEDLTKKINLV